MINNNSKILVMDSGFGGLSVLKELRKNLPNEDYIYYGDSKNAPYGEKTEIEVFELASNVIENVCSSYDIKACVIACNTTTVSNLEKLVYKFPELLFVGTTPNISEMVYEIKHGDLLVISTPITSKSEYLQNEISKYNNRNIISISMPGLMDFVEKLNFNEKDIFLYLDKYLYPFLNENIKAISLGCTHYPFLKGIIDKYTRQKGFVLKFFDSSKIVSDNLVNKLKEHSLINSSHFEGELIVLNSLNNEDVINKSFMLLER